MTIPSVNAIKNELILLLHESGNKLKTIDAYKNLATKFPQLDHEDVTIPHKSDSSGSKWNTAVRSVREILKQEGIVSAASPRGEWELTQKGVQLASFLKKLDLRV